MRDSLGSVLTMPQFVPDSSAVQARIKQIASILVEEGITSDLLYQFGATLEEEAKTIEIVRSAPGGEEDLLGYMPGVAPKADPETVARATRRIIDEVT